MNLFGKKSKDSDFYKIFIAVFLGIVCSILVFFAIFNIKYVINFIAKVFRILMPVIIGVVFAFLFNPIVSKLEKIFNKKKEIKKKNKLGRILGIVCTYFTFIFLIVCFLKLLVPGLLDNITYLVNNFPTYVEDLSNWIREVCEKYNVTPTFLDEYVSDINSIIKKIVVPNIDIIVNNLAAGISSVIKWIINFILSIIISVYLIYDKENYCKGIDKLLRAYTSKKVYNKIINIGKEIYRVLGGFMVAKLIDSLIIGIITFIALIILGIPYALLIAFVVGVTNIIPFFGPFIGAIPCTILLLMISPARALEFIFLIFLIQQFDGNILGPKLIGDKIGMKSFWVLFSILLFGGLFGIAGMIFAVPIFACIYEAIENSVDKKLKRENKTKKKEITTNKKTTKKK